MKPRLFLFGALAAAAVVAATAAVTPSVDAQTAVPEILVLRDNALVRITQTAPGTAKSTVTVTGLNSGDELVGIDVRPANNTLYGIARSGVIYTIDPVSGAATPGPTASTVPAGTDFGVDFNPAADRLRVVSTTGQSLRINVTDGATTVDTPVAYGGSDAGNGTAPAVAAVAYTNNDTDPNTATELFDIESTRDVLALQSPPNDGTLTTRGPLGVNAGVRSGFDVAPDGTAMAILAGTLYRVNLSTGAATSVGAVAGGVADGMAFVPATSSSAPTSSTSTTVATTSTSTTAPTTTTSTTSGVLPRTGNDSDGIAGAVGLALFVAGAAMVAATRSRTRPAHLLRDK